MGPIELTDKPLTIIYDGAKNLRPTWSPLMEASAYASLPETFHGSCAASTQAIVSTSANVSGETAPDRFSQIAGR